MILIVDDQKDCSMALERLLRCGGMETMSAGGGVEALAMLQVRMPALLVLDVHMPGMDGLALLRTIRADDGLKDVRVVMFSAAAEPKDMLEARRLGALDFLIKSMVGCDRLVARIGELAAEPIKPG